MKKKIIIPIAIVFAILVLLMCIGMSENAKVDEAMKNIETAIIAEDYSKAADYCHMAEQEGHATEEITALNEVLTAYINAQTALENNDYEAAQAALDEISYTDGFPSLMSNIEALKATASVTPTPIPTPTPTPKPTAKPTPKPTATPKQQTLLSEAECRKIALEGRSSDSKVKVEDMGGYYRYFITTYIPDADIEDEYSCSVDKYSGRVFDQAG